MDVMVSQREQIDLICIIGQLAVPGGFQAWRLRPMEYVYGGCTVDRQLARAWLLDQSHIDSNSDVHQQTGSHKVSIFPM